MHLLVPLLRPKYCFYAIRISSITISSFVRFSLFSVQKIFEVLQIREMADGVQCKNSFLEKVFSQKEEQTERQKKKMSRQTNSVTRFGEISPLWKKYTSLWQFFQFISYLAKC